MLNNSFFVSINSHVLDLFKKSLPVQFVYHNFNHTFLVVVTDYEIAKAERISESKIRLLLIAAWFHDTGLIRKTTNHEKCSKEIAQTYLKENGISEDDIFKVHSLINATKTPQNPTNYLENIICDADLFHLGSKIIEKNQIYTV